MLNFLARPRVQAFGRRWNYDTSYLLEILDAAGLGAILPLNALTKISRYRRDVPASVYYAAKITTSIAADCGPCAQLCIDMAAAEGVDEKTLRALAAGDERALGEAERLGYAFARAVLARENADELRAAIVKRWGPRAVVSIAYGLIAAEAYPTFKYATGHGRACTRLQVGGNPLTVREKALV
jgi:hypothetical protein